MACERIRRCSGARCHGWLSADGSRRISMSLLPIFVKLRDRLVVVVGGGAVAEGKIDGLFAAEARVRVVAPQVTPAIAQWIAHGKLEWRAKTFAPAELDGAYLVIAATSAAGINEAVF